MAGADLGLSPPAASAGELALTGTSGSLVVKAGRRQATINGVRHWLSYPTRIQRDSGLVSRVDLEKTIRPALQPVTTVVLDPGHGGYDRRPTLLALPTVAVRR